MTLHVNVDNFVRAESDRMFDNFVKNSGGTNALHHVRQPVKPGELGGVVRTNRDALFSTAIVDISEGATLSLPDAGDRYRSVMVVNQDHYINRIYHDGGSSELSVDEFDTPFVFLAVRTFFDPADPDDLAAVHALQDATTIEAKSNQPFGHPEFEKEGLDVTRKLLKELAEGLGNTDNMFGNKSDVDEVRHLIGAALGWGGMPESEAYYILQNFPQAEGHYTFTLRDVPVDAFWSVTVYDKDGYLMPNQWDAYNINSVTGVPEDDGSVVINIAPEPGDLPNFLYAKEGWTYGLRLYKPRPSVFDGTWTAPEPVKA